MFPHEVSPEIQLRLLQERHAAELFRLVDANRIQLRQWLPWLDRTKEEKDTAAFISSQLRSFADSGAFVCGIWHVGKLCGVVGYNQIDWSSKSAVLGYWLSEAAQKKGIMTACCRSLLEHAFGEYQLNRLMISVATGNQRSQAIPDRLGFSKEGILRDAEWLYDHFVDHTVNALLRKEKRPNQTPEPTAPSGRGSS